MFALTQIDFQQGKSLMAVDGPGDQYRGQFNLFAREYRRRYWNEEEREARFRIFARNLIKIEEHNRDETQGHKLGINHMIDLSQDEIKDRYLGLKGESPRTGKKHVGSSFGDISVDWVKQGKVTRVKNQGDCGSCWAFSAIGSVESLHAIVTGQLVEFSEQMLLDCDTQDDACKGGLMDIAYKFLEVTGIESEKDYPYKAREMKCQKEKFNPVWHIGGYVDVGEYDNPALLNALSKQPIAIAIEADEFVFDFYRHGIIKWGCGQNLDHGVLLVGAGEDDGVKYWKVKNSWGPSWGEDGYVRIKRETEKGKKSECGVSKQASYPTPQVVSII
eukprot:TRINITY_DN37089_c0_g1_i1.p1 TRINITY_DN37089_c0_g1~~TRINITY_DN37089_c0_g1_i1.p1  ORF type:complete len:361 (+),score=80.85 TRINITY_DN37089_c0_g1_i1:93-1085(+)